MGKQVTSKISPTQVGTGRSKRNLYTATKVSGPIGTPPVYITDIIKYDNAKTPNITYDQHPLIACTDLQSWGFKGLNFHWRQSRNYTWEELSGQLYIVQNNELDDLLAIPYAKFILNK